MTQSEWLALHSDYFSLLSEHHPFVLFKKQPLLSSHNDCIKIYRDGAEKYEVDFWRLSIKKGTPFIILLSV